MDMEYVKPALVLAGSAKALVLGIYLGDGDHTQPTMANTKPVPIALGLDD
jgi:hypothetical protein